MFNRALPTLLVNEVNVIQGRLFVRAKFKQDALSQKLVRRSDRVIPRIKDVAGTRIVGIRRCSIEIAQYKNQCAP